MTDATTTDGTTPEDPTPSSDPHTDDAPAAEIIPGAEPLSVAGGPAGALVLHGFTGNPQSMRGLAEAFAAAGFTVEMPLLPGHGTSIAHMLRTDWSDWSAAAEAAYEDLAGRCESVVVAGLSMGGTLTLWLAERHPEIAGLVAVNPACPPPGSSAEVVAGLEALLESGQETMDAIGGDIADPDARELAYEQVPLRGLVSLMRNAEDVAAEVGSIRSPLLLMTSPEDHVVDPANSDHLAAHVGGEVERVTLERSYHVATLDHDKELVEEQAVAFARRVTGT
ncbi:alpha/beta hydrolase [Actinomarinicola tropica]|uniref:Alpha/beta fold hydrolase n=1 Tax=Actinomarinicola tropica TaxID=2789776 RepID=A0A5Q2RCU2_9ACTN|nr:alpha/beta fold hydrolase [Actinomarinicola tropica]QGG94668.1 alpha/beta fold hydrolase [Actinomarinicola tropica]